MEYVQMTLNDWLGMKERLKKDLIGVQESFVRIGYTLRQIEEQELYRKDGYDSIADFARAEYHLSPSTVSRFIAINKKYSIDGYSEQLRPEFEEIGSSKLAEMLSLPDEDLVMIRPETTRESIRELKQFNRQESPAEAAGELREVIESFYRDNPEALNTLYAGEALQTGDCREMIEIINPSGSRTYRKGFWFLTMNEDRVMVKQFGKPPEIMEWAEFFHETREIFAGSEDGENTYEKHFGPRVAEPAKKTVEEPVEKTVAPAQESPKRLEKDEHSEEEKSIKTAVKSEENGRRGGLEPENPKPEQPNLTKPEAVEAQKTPKRLEKDEPQKTEISGEANRPADEFMNPPQLLIRKAYMEELTSFGLAEYLAKEMKKILNQDIEELSSVAFWEQWLQAEVDGRGEEVPCGTEL